jgi:2-polyprenyl-3-methyl-5-hydroxy-6-metoxy-1,4-benzoquinol methylase
MKTTNTASLQASQAHWEKVYSTKTANAVSWYQPHADESLQLIRQTGLPRDAALIDVGGGASTLVDDLLAAGYSDLRVLDLSEAALNTARQRLGPQASAQVNWRVGDITETLLPSHAYDLWHDRAVFHFLTEPAQRHAYVAAVMHSVKPGGHVIVATFAEDGPTQCSGLPVMRYSADALHGEFGDAFTLLHHHKESHPTPMGTQQQFVYCYCRKSLM